MVLILRTIILSFSYKWYEPLIDGRKIYEHRKRFCNEPVRAYIYLGVPYRQLVAIAELGKKENIAEWTKRYFYDKQAIARINECMTRNSVAMPIHTIQEIEPIDMREAEKKIHGFRVPISYMFLDDKPELFNYIKSKTVLKGKKIEHRFDIVDSEKICLY